MRVIELIFNIVKPIAEKALATLLRGNDGRNRPCAMRKLGLLIEVKMATLFGLMIDFIGNGYCLGIAGFRGILFYRAAQIGLR